MSTYRNRLNHPTEYCLHKVAGRNYSLLMGRAAAGIYAALHVLVPGGGAVGVPANTCYVVLWAMLRAHCTPVLLDIDPVTGNLPPNPDAQGRRLKAIIPCHMYGLPAPMKAICAWAREREIIVIEDVALALGATVDERRAGGWGEASVVSFGAGKIIDLGVGGAVLVDDARLATEIGRARARMPLWDDRLIDLTNQWQALYWALHQYEERNPGLSALYPRLYELYGELVAYRVPNSYWRNTDARFLLLREDRARRLDLAARYDALLGIGVDSEGAPSTQELMSLPRPDGSALWKYPLLVPPGIRDDLLAHLWDAGIHEATRWYPTLQVMTAALCPDVAQPPTPYADALAARIINLPLTDAAMAARCARVVRAFMASSERVVDGTGGDGK